MHDREKAFTQYAETGISPLLRVSISTSVDLALIHAKPNPNVDSEQTMWID